MENMREMLRGSLGRSLQALEPLDRLRAAWPVACGAAMARKGLPAAFEGGILRVEVPDTAWMEQMMGMRSVLQSELGRIAEVKLRGIHFYKAASSR
jgi:hypothetical protein